MSVPYDVTFIPLDSVFIANPCPAEWERMKGDDRARFCQTCAKNVYNLSAMSRAEAETLINEKEGKLCARYYARADGTIITADCPVGMRAMRGLMLRDIGAGLVATLALGFALVGIGNRQATVQSSLQSLTDLRHKIIAQLYPIPPSAIGGDIQTTTAFRPEELKAQDKPHLIPLQPATRSGNDTQDI